MIRETDIQDRIGADGHERNWTYTVTYGTLPPQEYPRVSHIGFDWCTDEFWDRFAGSNPQPERDPNAHYTMCEFVGEVAEIVKERYPGVQLSFDGRSIWNWNVHVHLEPWPREHRTEEMKSYLDRHEQVQREIADIKALVHQRGTFWRYMDDPEVQAMIKRRAAEEAAMQRRWEEEQASKRELMERMKLWGLPLERLTFTNAERLKAFLLALDGPDTDQGAYGLEF